MLDDLLDALADPQSVGMALLALALLATVYTLIAPMFGQANLARRMKGVKDARSEMRRRHRSQLGQNPSNLRLREETGGIGDLVRKLNLQKLLFDDTIVDKMLQAGLRGPRPMTLFYFFRFTMPLALGGLSFIFVSVFGDRLEIEPNHRLLIVAGAIGLGFYAPTIFISNRIAKRKLSIMQAFPDALDMMLICVESGMSIEMAMGRVGQEIGTASIELAEEMSLCTAELSYLPERRQAYENLARRTNHPGVKGVAMALVQAERYGTPLGQALRVMAKENRDLRMAEAEKKAAALPAKLTVPMIGFFLPVLCAVILAPAMIQVSQQLNK